MTKKNLMALSAATIAIASPTQLQAQDAAESAIILSGTANQAKANRSLGNAINNSINSAASNIRASNPRRNRTASPPRTRQNAPSVITTIGTGDALEGTDASAYQTGSGATIKVSGGFRPSATAHCTENCEGEASGE